jgi:flagellar biosynthetic protein FlhB
MAGNDQKTEKPTPRRVDKARREGQFVVAREFVSAFHFAAAVAICGAWGGQWIGDIRETMRTVLSRAFQTEAGPLTIAALSANILTRSFRPLIEAGGAILLVTLAGQFAVTKLGFSLKKLSPSVQRLNLLNKLRETPRQNVRALVQACIMLPLFTWAVYAIARDNIGSYLSLPLKSVRSGAMQIGLSLQDLLWKVTGVLVVLGLVDLLRQRRRYDQELRMSRQEIRDEGKEIEGNPQTKLRIRRMQRELLRGRMMRQVPSATAVIVNPTHFAVALRYQMDQMAAPSVVAKGKNYLALRIRRKAEEHGIPIIENPPLAQALYASSEVGQEIPPHLYRAVAEILAYIYRLMNGRSAG